MCPGVLPSGAKMGLPWADKQARDVLAPERRSSSSRLKLVPGFACVGEQRFACRRCCLVLRLRQGNIADMLLILVYFITQF
jgi:hypothetical protein